MYYETYDPSQILESMNQVISEKGNPVVVKFAEEQVYEEARNDILERVVKQAARNLADWYGLSQVNYQYLDEEKLNKITIYWEYS